MFATSSWSLDALRRSTSPAGQEFEARVQRSARIRAPIRELRIAASLVEGMLLEAELGEAEPQVSHPHVEAGVGRFRGRVFRYPEGGGGVGIDDVRELVSEERCLELAVGHG
jgi:hypothetical protein